MLKRIKSDSALAGVHASSRSIILVGVIGTLGPLIVFLLALSNIGNTVKFVSLAAAMGTFLFVFNKLRSGLLLRHPSLPDTVKETRSGDISDGLNEKLIALDEANRFFGSSLSQADMFRLVSSRVGDICPTDTAALFVMNDERTKLTASFADGRNAAFLQGFEVEAGSGLAGMAAASGAVEKDPDLMVETFSLPADALRGIRYAVAIPLIYESTVFAVYVIYSDEATDENNIETEVFEAIGERIAPLFQGSMAFEQSISSALTDVLTGLPNERAFFMVLENQLAESVRYRSERPLTVLTIDIKGFAQLNSDLGHAVGNGILEFTRDRIKEQLRKMDFLARMMNDEFAVILPTASEKTAAEIMARIKNVFAATPFSIAEDEELKIWLNFGWATFWKDGETVEQLVRSAQVRKQQEKSEEPAGVLWFPREYVN